MTVVGSTLVLRRRAEERSQPIGLDVALFLGAVRAGRPGGIGGAVRRDLATGNRRFRLYTANAYLLARISHHAEAWRVFLGPERGL
jgi:hypothetical protein